MQEQEKINWQPVWDSDPIPGDPSRFEVNPNPMAPMFPTEAKDNLGPCDAPNGLGIHNLFIQAKKLLPLPRIRSIVRRAANDPEVRAMMQFLNSNDYRQGVANLTQSREYIGLRDFACYKLNLDLKFCTDFVKDLLQLSELSKLKKNEGEIQQEGALEGEVGRRSGLSGLLEDICVILPQQKLRDLFETLKNSDWYLMRAVRTTKTYEYEAILKLYRQNPDYVYLKNAWSKIGMPLDELWNLLYIALGWSEERLREPLNF
ncbi:uncharacterized protein [Eurosta solidaginis]|uniref:uncharacterized protein n=1 Tax=Eurosta solidaginis TaxID=178769 RepID=UPI003530D9AF